MIVASRRARSGHYVLIAFLAAACSTYQVRYWWDFFTILLHPESHARAPLVTDSHRPTIRIVLPEAEAVGIKAGDVLKAVSGRDFTGRKVLATEVRSKRPGDPLALTVAPAEGPSHAAGPPHTASMVLASREATIERRPGKSAMAWSSSWVLGTLASVIVPAACLLLGFAVVILRPWDPIAWMLLAMMLGFGNVFVADVPWEGWEPWLRPAAVAYKAISPGLWAAGMMLFGMYFPERFSLDRSSPWIKWLVLVPLALSHAALATVKVADTESFAVARIVEPIAGPADAIASISAMVAIGFFFFALGTKTGTIESPDARRRVRLLWAGAELSMTPAFVVFLIGLARGQNLTSSPWMILPTLLLLLFPFTMAYVIVVHRALDLRVAIRQGLQYALARGGIRAVQVIISAVILTWVMQLAVNPATSRIRLVLLLAAGTAAVVAIIRSADRLRGWIDRRFFREAYNAERVLTDLIQDVRTMVETKPLMETVAQRISTTLHVPRLAFVLNREGRYAPAFASGYASVPQAEFSESRGVLQQLRKERDAVLVYLDDPNSWVNRDGLVDETERAALARLDAQLVLPLTSKDTLLGFISLGPKLSEEPYSSSDIRLLGSVAAQAGLALENGRLTEAIATEVARRERLNRELEIAREVQERLFPQDRPPVRGLEYAGQCRPARGVGGDYFDFIALDDGAFGLAIGDVSGKGIPAALLMASLQASIRGQAISGDTDVARLMTNVNRLTYEATPANRYATLFYGRYEPWSRVLTYVNAGHNAPMLIRDGGQMDRLEVGGPVVGLLYPTAFEQGSVVLNAGDVLVLYTDGISEAQNGADEEWGEESLAAAATACSAALPAVEIVSRLFTAADGFVAGAAQYDDMTLVVVRATLTRD